MGRSRSIKRFVDRLLYRDLHTEVLTALKLQIHNHVLLAQLILSRTGAASLWGKGKVRLNRCLKGKDYETSFQAILDRSDDPFRTLVNALVKEIDHYRATQSPYIPGLAEPPYVPMETCNFCTRLVHRYSKVDGGPLGIGVAILCQNCRNEGRGAGHEVITSLEEMWKPGCVS